MSTSLVAGRMAAVQEVLPAVQDAPHQQNSNAWTCIANRPNLLHLKFATEWTSWELGSSERWDGASDRVTQRDPKRHPQVWWSLDQISFIDCIQYFIALPYITLHYTTLHYIVLHYTVLHYTILHHTVLHRITLQCILLHSIIIYYAVLLMLCIKINILKGI